MRSFLPLLLAAALSAEVHTLTLAQAVSLALKRNPEIAQALLDEQIARQAVRIARDPFIPQVGAGSGLAYSSGYPMSIEGSGPSIFQARATQFVFNRPQTYAVAQANEAARGASIATAASKEDVAFRVASLFLDAERAARLAGLARQEMTSLEKAGQAVRARIEEGRELPIEAKRSALAVARARQTAEALESDLTAAGALLAVALGFGAEDRVLPAREERAAPPLPASEESAVRSALDSSKALRHLESRITAKGLELRGEKAARLPRVDLVAQYALFSKFNNYEEFFRRFERHNGQVGVSFQVPVLPGPGIRARTAQTESEIARLRIELTRARNDITAEVRRLYDNIRRAEAGAEVARLDLEIARDQLSILLAQMQEGRASLRQVEEARAAETAKWIAFHDTQFVLEKARWALLRHTGDLLAAVQ